MYIKSGSSNFKQTSIGLFKSKGWTWYGLVNLVGVIVKVPPPRICWLARSCCRAERTEYYVTTQCRHCSPHLGLLLYLHVVVGIDSLKYSLENAQHQEDPDSGEHQDFLLVSFTKYYKVFKAGWDNQLISWSTEVVFMLLLKSPCSADHRFCGMPSNTGVGCWTKSTSEIEPLSGSIWTGLEMVRNEKRKTSESEVDEDDGGDVDASTPVFKPGFFVPCHPILTAGIIQSICQPPYGLMASFASVWLLLSVIVYGLYLTVASALCPNTCLPDYLPIASFATSSGRNHQNFAEGFDDIHE